MGRFGVLVGTFMALAAPALAGLEARFIEGAPKDRFVVSNSSACTLAQSVVTFDIGASPSGLIFDVTSRGAGVEVFQPFEVVEGAALLASLPEVSDGDQAISLPIKALAPGESVSFTIDVDDTGGGREITVSGSEIAGAVVSLRHEGETESAVFDTSARANLALPGCLS